MKSDYRHICLLHEAATCLNVSIIAPFMADGIENGGRALFSGSDEMVTTLKIRLTEGHVDVAKEIERGSLLFVSKRNHLSGGRFDPTVLLDQAEKLYFDTMAAGYQGLWGAGDVSWEFASQGNLPKLLEYEYGVDKLVERLSNFHTICQYDRNTLPLRSMGNGLLTHRAILTHYSWPRPNPFFTFPEPVLREAPTEPQIERMLNVLDAY